MSLREVMALVGNQAQETAAFLGIFLDMLTRKDHDVGNSVLSNISGKAEGADSRLGMNNITKWPTWELYPHLCKKRE